MPLCQKQRIISFTQETPTESGKKKLLKELHPK
jgi:hypothetical protein